MVNENASPKNRDRHHNPCICLSLRAPEGCVAIRHAVSLRGTFAALSVDSAETVSVRFLAEFTLNEVKVLGMTLRLGSWQAFQVSLRSLPRALGLLRRTAPCNDRRGVPLLAKTTPTSVFGWRFLLGKDGSSGSRVGAWKDVGGSQGSPLLCKEGRGEVVMRPSLWMPLPLPASPYKGEETEWRPHKPEEPEIKGFRV